MPPLYGLAATPDAAGLPEKLVVRSNAQKVALPYPPAPGRGSANPVGLLPGR